MTRFALGAKCGSPGRPPVAAGVGGREAVLRSSDASAAVPMPVLRAPKKWRRVSSRVVDRCHGFIPW